MREFILNINIYIGVLVCSNVQAGLVVYHEVKSRESISRTCLRVEFDDEAKCAEGNIASFFNRNREAISALKNMDALEPPPQVI